ncbi:MAG: lipoprotein insertase outer membrane protein LolB [Methylococcaceae bacterium]
MEPPYSRAARVQLYDLPHWSLEGRVAVAGKNDSWSANIAWGHRPDKEHVKLSGPLGQGATIIEMTGDVVTMDRGDGHVQTSTQPELFINQQLGMFVPLQSLRYWVIGVPEPNQAFTEIGDGFAQAGWLVEYKQMQMVENTSMPRKITVVNNKVRLKLIIDQWALE